MSSPDFTPWQSTDGPLPSGAPVQSLRPYAPLMDTLRLYAGWLLAWYAVLFLLAGQHALGRLPLQWEWVHSLAASPLVLRFAFGTFLFLLLSTLHRTLRGRTGSGVVFGIVWVVLVGAFVMSE